MEYYYKQIDGDGNITMLLTCSMHLASSDTQIEITAEEYGRLYAEMDALGAADDNPDNDEIEGDDA